MTLTPEHIDFENFSRKLIGLKIIKVEYSEISYDLENSKPYYPTKFKNLDSVDFSIFLHTTNGSLVEIYWDDKFFQYGIGIKVNGHSDFPDYIIWNVSDNELWRQIIGTRIYDIQINWEAVTTKDEKTGMTESYNYPQDIKITFSNDKNIFISASGFLEPDDNEVYGMLDNLTVTDNEELARQVNMIN